MARAATPQAVVLLIELVVVVVEVADGNHAFTLVLVQLYVEAPFGHTGDNALIDLTHMLGHELHLFVLHAGSFGRSGQLLHRTAVFAEGLILLLCHGMSTLVKILGEQPVHHHVGVATDRRSEVGVVVEGQTVMADVMHRVACLLHGAYRYRFNQVLLLASLHIIEQPVDALRYLTLVACGTYLVAKAGNELRQVIQLLRIGQVVDTVGEYLCLLSLRYASNLLCHGAVGQQHELLHQLVGIFRYLEIDAQRLALLVDFELHLVAVEVDGTRLEALFAQQLGQFVELLEFLHIVTLSRFESLLRLLVGKASVALDDGVYHTAFLHLGPFVHLEDDAIGQLLLVGAKRAEEVTEPFG